MRSWVARHRPRVEACDHALAEPVEGGAELARVLARVREQRLVAAADRAVADDRR